MSSSVNSIQSFKWLDILTHFADETSLLLPNKSILMTVLKGGEWLMSLMIYIIFITNEPPIHYSFSVLFKHASIIHLLSSAMFSVFSYCRLIIKNEHYDVRIGLVLPDGL